MFNPIKLHPSLAHPSKQNESLEAGPCHVACFSVSSPLFRCLCPLSTDSLRTEHRSTSCTANQSPVLYFVYIHEQTDAQDSSSISYMLMTGYAVGLLRGHPWRQHQRQNLKLRILKFLLHLHLPQLFMGESPVYKAIIYG